MVALPGDALMQLIVGGTILPALIYGATVVLYLAVRKRLEHKEGGFSLGRFELPVAIAALIWVAAALFVLVTPKSNFVPALVVVGLILVGGLYFAYMMIFNREVLETEPGEDVLAAVPEATDVTATAARPGRTDRPSRPPRRRRLPGRKRRLEPALRAPSGGDRVRPGDAGRRQRAGLGAAERCPGSDA